METKTLEQAEKMLSYYDYCYYFTKYDCRPKMNNKFIGLRKNNLSPEKMNELDAYLKIKGNKKILRRLIRSKGFKFYTTDADELSKCYGYYIKNWHDGSIEVDFDPLDDYTENDLGHVRMYYYTEKTEWAQL
jgi:hypothetical protein